MHDRPRIVGQRREPRGEVGGRQESSVAEIAGETTARAIQLGIEYDPVPPFDSGHPDRASAAIKLALSDRYEKANLALRVGIEQAECYDSFTPRRAR